jgi:hypothetical protein
MLHWEPLSPPRSFSGNNTGIAFTVFKEPGRKQSHKLRINKVRLFHYGLREAWIHLTLEELG